MASPLKIMVLKWSDILAEYSLYLMITYLTNVWEMNFMRAAAIVNIFWGLVAIMPIPMQFIKDSKLQNRWMVLLCSLAYTTGLGFLAISTPEILSKSSGRCTEYKPECIGTGNKMLFYTALVLLVLGKSGYTTSLEELITEQTRGIISRIKVFLSSINVLILVHLIGVLAIPYILKRWSTKFGVPALCMAFSTCLFITGFRSYGRETEKPGLLTQACNLITRCVPCLTRSEDDGVETASGHQTTGQQQNKGHELRELIRKREKKFIMSLIPLCLLGVVSSIGNTYFLEQGNHMETKILGPLKVPLVILPGFYYLARFLFPRLYFYTVDCCTSPCFQCVKRWCHRIGIALSLMFALLCCITASKVESRRLHIAEKHGLVNDEKHNVTVPMNILHLLPQFILLGGLDGMAYESVERFFKDQEIPPSLKPYTVDSVIGVFGVGKIGNVLLAYIVDKITEKGGKPGWIAATVNSSRLDNYYWLLATLTAINIFWYIFVTIHYPPKARENSFSCLPCCTSTTIGCCPPW